jgi:UDPglucose 6-dehydrogenase
MRVAVVGGTGYVGLVTAIGLAVHKNHVVCVDIDSRKIKHLNQGEIPIYEKGLNKLLKIALRKKRIHFKLDFRDAIINSEIIMVTVGTPEGEDGDVDLSQVFTAVKIIAEYIGEFKTIVIKSTVPVGTCDTVRRIIKENLRDEAVSFEVVFNPEFLSEGNAVQDFMNPERIVIGADSIKAANPVKKLYRTFKAPVIITDIRSAELVKYACNAYLANRISFINEIAEISEKVNADIHSVIKCMKLDKRIGKYHLNPGPGFGGPCLSKDLKSLVQIAKDAGANHDLLQAVLARNETQIENLIQCLQLHRKREDLKRIGVLGLSYKAGTNDVRNSPAIKLIERLSVNEEEIVVFDPVVKQLDGPIQARVYFADCMEEAIQNADCLIIMTEWDEFKNLNLEKVALLMRNPFIIDTRNILPTERARHIGFRYIGTGINFDSRSFLPDQKLEPDQNQIHQAII